MHADLLCRLRDIVTNGLLCNQSHAIEYCIHYHHYQAMHETLEV